MTKVRVEIEVPENCKDCMMFYGEDRYCDLFECFITYDEDADNFNRCDKCKQAEVENDT